MNLSELLLTALHRMNWTKSEDSTLDQMRFRLGRSGVWHQDDRGCRVMHITAI